MPDRTVRKGRLTLTNKQFAFGDDSTRQRPTHVTGILSAFTATGSASPPLSHYSAGLTGRGAATDPMEGCDKGHVIAASMSNVSAPENIVPMYPSFNRQGGLWKALEDRVRSYVKTSYESYHPRRPREVEMTVGIRYEGTNDPRFPTAFEVTVRDSAGYLYFNGGKLNGLVIPHRAQWSVSVNVWDEDELGKDLVRRILWARRELRLTGWKIEDMFPTRDQPVLAPIGELTRPYAALDWLWLQKKDEKVLKFLKGTKYRHGRAARFSEPQKQLIRAVNRLDHDNCLVSDYHGDHFENLIVGSGQRAAEVDHVVPYSERGSNLFSNALIASGEFNNKVKAKSWKHKRDFGIGGTLPRTDRHLGPPARGLASSSSDPSPAPGSQDISVD